ncbi:MAG: hypothetical protein JWO03_2616 [Bacteroidetes bacterium]|nr:hypothetical protein [Bacteroidota bacterium]
MKKQTKVLVLTFLTVCEIGCFFLSPYSVFASTLIYTLIGIAIAVIPLTRETSGGDAPLWGKFSSYSYLIYLAGIFILCNWIKNTFTAHIYSSTLDAHMGDMLLFLREMSQRYLDHQHVYDPISDIHGTPVHAVYLPGFWLHFCIPMSLGKDMRWASLAAVLISVLMATWVRRASFSHAHLLLFIPLSLFAYLIMDGAAYYIMFTQEAIVLLYVGLLCFALAKEYWILAGVAAALCIMSRYFIGAPLLAGIIWLYFTDRTAARKVFFATIASLAAILTLSRSWGDSIYFFKIPLLYAGFLSDTSSFEAFHHIYYRSVGFAAIFDVGHIHILTWLNILVLLLLPPAYFLFARRCLRDSGTSLVLMCGIKLFLVLFLVTLSKPFGYVLYTSSFLSVILLKNVLNTTVQKEAI